MKLLTKEKCPECNKEFDSQHELENLEPKINKGKIEDVASTSKPEEKPEPEIKEVIKTVAPNDQGFFKCKNCGDAHKNPNYSKRPNKKCETCGTLNGDATCSKCGNHDPEEFEEKTPEELDEMNIPIPPEKEHEHEEE